MAVLKKWEGPLTLLLRLLLLLLMIVSGMFGSIRAGMALAR